MMQVHGEGCVRQVSSAYLDGITEGRQFLRANPDTNPQDMTKLANNARVNMMQHSGLMRDCFKGQHDFWHNQIKAKINA